MCELSFFYIDCCRIIFRRNKLLNYIKYSPSKRRNFLFYILFEFFFCIASLTYLKCVVCIAIRNRFYLKIFISQCFVYELNKEDKLLFIFVKGFMFVLRESCFYRSDTYGHIVIL